MFERLLSDFARLNVLSFDGAAATIFEALKCQGLRVGTMDLRIAAVALSRGFMVITRNMVDFSRIRGLSCEDWTVPIA
jgi:tRNA(fMet)-specific endonuclease VapC